MPTDPTVSSKNANSPPLCLPTWWATARWRSATRNSPELLEEHRRLFAKSFPRFQRHGNQNHRRRFSGRIRQRVGSGAMRDRDPAGARQAQSRRRRRPADRTQDRHSYRRRGASGGDVYGDGVNIASRIEQLAGAGGICVSMDVERQIRNALEARFEKFGSADLKNITCRWICSDRAAVGIGHEGGTDGGEGREEIARRGFDRCSGSDRTAQRCVVVGGTLEAGSH